MPEARIYHFRRPAPDSWLYDRALRDQQAHQHAISPTSARPLDCDFAERLQLVEEDTRRDLRVLAWQNRIGWACLVLACLTVLYFCFELGRMM